MYIWPINVVLDFCFGYLKFRFWWVRKGPPSGRFQKRPGKKKAEKRKTWPQHLGSGLLQVTQHDLRLKVPTTSAVVCDFFGSRLLFWIEGDQRWLCTRCYRTLALNQMGLGIQWWNRFSSNDARHECFIHSINVHIKWIRVVHIHSFSHKGQYDAPTTMYLILEAIMYYTFYYDEIS